MSTHPTLTANRGYFSLAPVIKSDAVDNMAEEEMGFSNEHQSSVFALSPRDSSTLGIPGMQEIFGKVSLHPSPILAATLNRCGDATEVNFSHSAYSTDTTPNSHYSDSFNHGNGQLNADNSFETSSSSAMDLADFPSTFISGPFSDFNSFSCDPTNSCDSSPVNMQLTNDDPVMRVSTRISVDDSPPNRMPEDEETDIVPNELVQFVSESTLRIAGDMADAISVTDSDMDDLDHDSRLNSLCLPILQPPSLVSSHVSDNMRPPSLSPEPTVDSTDDFVDPDFTKRYFSPSPKVFNGLYSSVIESHRSTPMTVPFASTGMEFTCCTSPPLYSSIKCSPPPLPQSILSSAPRVKVRSSTVQLPDNASVSSLERLPMISNNQLHRLSETFHSSNTVSQPLTARVSMQNEFSPIESLSPRLKAQFPLANEDIDIALPHHEISGFSDETIQPTHILLSRTIPPLSVGQFEQRTKQSRCLLESQPPSLPSSLNNSKPPIFSVQSVTIPLSNSVQVPIANNDPKFAREVCLLKTSQTPDSKLVQSLRSDHLIPAQSQPTLVNGPLNNAQLGVSTISIPTAPPVMTTALPSLQPMVVCSQGTPNLPASSPVQLSTKKQCLLSSGILSGLNATKESLPPGTVESCIDGIHLSLNGGAQLSQQQNPILVSSSGVSNGLVSSSGTRPISIFIPLPNRTTNQGPPQQPATPNTNCSANQLTLQLLNSLPALRPGMSILLNIKNQTSTALLNNVVCAPNVNSQVNIATSTGSSNAMVFFPESGSSAASNSPSPTVQTSPSQLQPRLGMASSVTPTSLVVVPNLPSSSPTASAVTNGVYSLSTNNGLSTSQPFSFPISTHFFLLRSPPKVQIKPEASPIGVGSTAQSGMALVLAPNSVQKPLSDSTNVFFIPSMAPNSVGLTDTPLWFPSPNPVNNQTSLCNTSSVTPDPSFLTAFGRLGTEQSPSANSLASMAYVQPSVGNSCEQLLTQPLPSLLSQPLPINQSTLSLSSLLPESTHSSFTIQSPWVSMTNNFTPTNFLQANTQTVMNRLNTLASSLSSPCLSFDATLPSTLAPTTCALSQVTQSVSALSCNSTLVSFVGPVISSPNDITASASAPLVATTDSGNVDVGDTGVKQPIVLPSADNLLSSRLSVVPTTSLVNTVASSLLSTNQLVTSVSSSSPSALAPQVGTLIPTSDVAIAVTSTSKSVSTSSSGSGRRRHQCPFCPKSCERKDNLQAHIRTHTGERPYPCRFCPKAFPQKDHLRAHIRTHTGEKPYHCPQCMKAFAQLGNLHRHVKTHRR